MTDLEAVGDFLEESGRPDLAEIVRREAARLATYDARAGNGWIQLSSPPTIKYKDEGEDEPADGPSVLDDILEADDDGLARLLDLKHLVGTPRSPR